ncbi:MAG: hypothetical protein KGI54_10305 [Pseudomonadota bacterium]|nr:hypothetical protein [Pseudomonadota bacterium]
MNDRIPDGTSDNQESPIRVCLKTGEARQVPDTMSFPVTPGRSVETSQKQTVINRLKPDASGKD